MSFIANPPNGARGTVPKKECNIRRDCLAVWLRGRDCRYGRPRFSHFTKWLDRGLPHPGLWWRFPSSCHGPRLYRMSGRPRFSDFVKWLSRPDRST